KQRGMTGDEFYDYAALSLVHERLVLDAIGAKSPEAATPALLELWLKEARERHQVVDDPDKLPAGVVARIGKGKDAQDLAALELGRVLLRTARADERERYTKQIVICRLLETRAARAGISVSQSELDEEVKARRAGLEKRGESASFDQLLATQGSSAELL